MELPNYAQQYYINTPFSKALVIILSSVLCKRNTIRKIPLLETVIGKVVDMSAEFSYICRMPVFI